MVDPTHGSCIDDAHDFSIDQVRGASFDEAHGFPIDDEVHGSSVDAVRDCSIDKAHEGDDKSTYSRFARINDFAACQIAAFAKLVQK